VGLINQTPTEESNPYKKLDESSPYKKTIICGLD
jgi:hypothetical protein